MSTIEKITIRDNKVLKLNSVLIRKVSENELIDIAKVGYMMESYIKSKGNTIVGPSINYTTVETDESGQEKVVVKLMCQLRSPIHNIEAPYEFENQIKVKDCLFARFNEKEENLQFAYSKLQVYAFENDIKLKGDSYTVFVDNKEGKLLADVFMEVNNGGLAGEGV